MKGHTDVLKLLLAAGGNAKATYYVGQGHPDVHDALLWQESHIHPPARPRIVTTVEWR